MTHERDAIPTRARECARRGRDRHDVLHQIGRRSTCRGICGAPERRTGRIDALRPARCDSDEACFGKRRREIEKALPKAAVWVEHYEDWSWTRRGSAVDRRDERLSIKRVDRDPVAPARASWRGRGVKQPC